MTGIQDDELPAEALRVFEAQRAAKAKGDKAAVNGDGAAPAEISTGKATADDKDIARLAALPKLEYERTREDAAKKLGVRKSILDKLVAAARPSDRAPGQGRPLELPAPESWPEPVDGADL